MKSFSRSDRQISCPAHIRVSITLSSYGGSQHKQTDTNIKLRSQGAGSKPGRRRKNILAYIESGVTEYIRIPRIAA